MHRPSFRATLQLSRARRKNGQPWRLRLEGGTLIVACKTDKPYWTAPFDCGIALLHVALGAMHAGIAGRWEDEPYRKYDQKYEGQIQDRGNRR